MIFHPDDDALLHYLEDDGQSIEPEYYVPVIPLVLVNGSDGIGTGWSSQVGHVPPPFPNNEKYAYTLGSAVPCSTAGTARETLLFFSLACERYVRQTLCRYMEPMARYGEGRKGVGG